MSTIAQEIPDHFALLTMWLRLASILNNNDGDISMRNYSQIKKANHSAPATLQKSEVKTLDCIAAVLVWDNEIISSSYKDVPRCKTTRGEENGSEETDILPLKFFVLNNPKDFARDFDVRITEEGNSIWPTIREQDVFHAWK